ncbi:MAG TPA: phytoene/squalene synthase family protein [Anaerolineae bacterium]|nr:phytoene/squalene synthase family protein [Anaerolineae bacterium]
MASTTLSWEQTLFQLADQALTNHTPIAPVKVENAQLEAAYQHCTDITKQHSQTFYLASALLPYQQRKAVRALYAFCRISDDLVDCGGPNAHQDLAAWRQLALSPHPSPQDFVALAWADTRARYNIPRHYAEQLLDGVTQDLNFHRYQTFSDLAQYCYAVASTVGLMSMHIVGFSGPEAIPYAIKLGVALQLTNILRDIQEDWHNGRFYLPLDELAAFNLTIDDIANRNQDQRWHHFMQFQIERTRRLYRESFPGIDMLNPQGRFAISAAAELYRAILDDIEEHQYDVFSRRAHTTRLEKVSLLPGIWWRSHAGYPTP